MTYPKYLNYKSKNFTDKVKQRRETLIQDCCTRGGRLECTLKSAPLKNNRVFKHWGELDEIYRSTFGGRLIRVMC